MGSWRVITLRLRGFLAKEFGHIHRCSVRSIHDIFSYLRSNFPWDAWLRARQHWYFRVVANGEDCGTDQFSTCNFTEIDIIPMPRASSGILNSPIFKIVLGIGLLAAGIATGNPGMALMGAGLILKGIVQLLKPKDNPGYYFSGSATTVKPGSVVPVLYGRCLIKPVPISFEVTDIITGGIRFS